MSISQCTLVLRRSQCVGSARLVLLAIAVHVNPQSEVAWPSVPTLARETRLSERHVYRLIQKLEAAGELEVRRRPGLVNHYRVKLSPTPDSFPSIPTSTPDYISHPTRDLIAAVEQKERQDIALTRHDLGRWLTPGSRVWDLLAGD
jgi:Helix-turn-helix domain